MHLNFYTLAALMFFITFPIAYFTVVLLDSENKVEKGLDISAIAYLLLTVIAAYNRFPIQDIVHIAITASGFMVTF